MTASMHDTGIFTCEGKTCFLPDRKRINVRPDSDSLTSSLSTLYSGYYRGFGWLLYSIHSVFFKLFLNERSGPVFVISEFRMPMYIASDFYYFTIKLIRFI